MRSCSNVSAKSSLYFLIKPVTLFSITDEGLSSGITKACATSSGVFLIISDTIIPFIHTLLPLPVEPAINKCGILAMLHTSVEPIIPFPKEAINFSDLYFLGIFIIISLIHTGVGSLLGISIPTVCFPGIGA